MAPLCRVYRLRLVLLGALVGTGWETFWIFMIPIAFLFVLPYIAGFLKEGCNEIAERILDRWREPLYGRQDDGSVWYDENLTYDENYIPILPEGNDGKNTENQYGGKEEQ